MEISNEYVAIRDGKIYSRFSKKTEPTWLPLEQSAQVNHRYAHVFPSFGAAVKFTQMNNGCAIPLTSLEIK